MWRRRFFGGLVLLVLLTAVAPFAIRHEHAYYLQWRFARIQTQCAQNTAPPTQLVFDSDPPSLPADFVDLRGRSQGQRLGAARLARDCWAQWTPLLGYDTSGLLYPPGLPLAPVFLHARRAEDGTERIIAITQPWCARWINGQPQGEWAIQACDIVPGSTTIAPVPHRYSGINFHLDPAQRLRVYAGQIDPSDPSHFTIVYDVDGKSGRIDGYFTTNGPFGKYYVTLKTARRIPGGLDLAPWGQ